MNEPLEIRTPTASDYRNSLLGMITGICSEKHLKRLYNLATYLYTKREDVA